MFRPDTIEKMFASTSGSAIYDRILHTVERENMRPLIHTGVVIGFSGGADSVLLTSFLKEYERRNGKHIPMLAVHVNHGIRGAEAERDERFSFEFTNQIGIDFYSHSVDIPTVSRELGIGTEEAARNARYSIFSNIILSRDDLSAIAVAHNATDNAETVIMNILRGCGLSGACGIKPIRDNIFRPLIAISKSEILSLLDEHQIPYVTDSTNLTSDYSRNYVRNEILPLLKRLSGNPDAAFLKLSENLRSDLDYINTQAIDFINSECTEGIINSKLMQLHPSVFAKVMSMLIHDHTGAYPEEKHIQALSKLLSNDNFTYSLQGSYNFVCERGICTFLPKKNENTLVGQIFSLTEGENKISGTNLTVLVGDIAKTSLNVYNFSIQARISSDIINDGLILRFKKDGDSYKYSGMTHKLKKVFNDRNIPKHQRSFIPVLCDSKGIVFVPGMSVRDDAKNDDPRKNVCITFAFSEIANGEVEVFTAHLRK